MGPGPIGLLYGGTPALLFPCVALLFPCVALLFQLAYVAKSAKVVGAAAVNCPYLAT